MMSLCWGEGSKWIDITVQKHFQYSTETFSCFQNDTMQAIYSNSNLIWKSLNSWAVNWQSDKNGRSPIFCWDLDSI